MASFEPGTLIIKGDVRRAYGLQAPAQEVYDYLSNIKTLLLPLPNTRRLQIGTKSGKARVFTTVQALGVLIDGVIDVEPSFEPEKYTIRLKTPVELLGPLPPGLLSGRFQGFIKVTPTEKGSQVSSRIVLAFDAAQVELLNLVPRVIIETSGPLVLQEYAENMCDEYIQNLLRNFRRWQAEHLEGKA